MNNRIYRDRIRKCCRLMRTAGLDVLLLTKPSNMFYLTGDGRLCAFAMITQKGKVALGVPQTDVKDVKSLAYFNHLVGFEDEVGMIHSIARMARPALRALRSNWSSQASRGTAATLLQQISVPPSAVHSSAGLNRAG